MTSAERFERKFTPEPNTGCWLWTAAEDGKGYGNLGGAGWYSKAHRYSYELERGKIPAGLQLDHVFRVRSCVNPAHLEPVTNAENTRRGDAGLKTGAMNRAKTHCPRGHAYAGNTYLYRGSRTCCACYGKRPNQ